MLFQPDTIQNVANLQRQDLLQALEARRLFRELSQGQPGWWQRVSRRLMAAGLQVKILGQVRPATTVFSHK